uniref:Uncharacterized protein n=1 Tax=Oryza meridionalis TaxID=40149 RepID=A0A0E0BYS9_9ORYZ
MVVVVVGVSPPWSKKEAVVHLLSGELVVVVMDYYIILANSCTIGVTAHQPRLLKNGLEETDN